MEDRRYCLIVSDIVRRNESRGPDLCGVFVARQGAV